MSLHRVFLPAAFILVAGTFTYAVSTSWLTSSDLPATGKGMSAKPKPQVAPNGGNSYPAFITGKTLYAKTDLRGKQAPKLEVEKWLRGAPQTKGKILLVDFWATWCGPCRAVIPELNDFQKTYAKDLVVIGVSDEKEETVSKFMKETPMQYSIAVDTKRKMYGVLGVQGIPHVMIVTPDGVVRWQGFPGSKEDPLTSEKVGQIIKAWKAGQR